MMTSGPLLAPFRNCWSVSVMVLIGCSSTRAVCAAPVDDKKVCDNDANATTAVSLADLKAMGWSSRMNGGLASGGVRKQMFRGAKPKGGGVKRECLPMALKPLIDPYGASAASESGFIEHTPFEV